MPNVPIIPTVEQIRECERYTMEIRHITSEDLMEEAGQALSQRIISIIRHKEVRSVYLFCGIGNNGGDGFVIARCLRAAFSPDDLAVHVILCQSESARHTAELEVNIQRWQLMLQQQYADETKSSFKIFKPDCKIQIADDDLVIDALFGIGLNKAVTGIFKEAICLVNESEAYTIAIDIPSRLFADRHTPPDDGIVIADKTLTVQFPKLVFMLPEAYPIYGDVEIVDIGMLVPPKMDFGSELLTIQNVKHLLRPIHPYGHKGMFGHGLLVAGCDRMPGAAVLAAMAALRGGIGKLTVHTAGNAAAHFPSVLPEAILHPDANEQVVSNIDRSTLSGDIKSIAVGPGLGTSPQTVAALKKLLDETQEPLIIDADALNILADNKTRLAFLPPYSILTPHCKEFERLTEPADNDFHRLQLARDFAKRYEVILILKGHHTVISLPDGKQFFNTTGNVCMATAGSGDTLTGLLLALMAQGYNPVETAFLGVYVHGAAGDMFRSDNFCRGMLASDLTKFFGCVFQRLYDSQTN